MSLRYGQFSRVLSAIFAPRFEKKLILSAKIAGDFAKKGERDTVPGTLWGVESESGISFGIRQTGVAQTGAQNDVEIH